MTKRLLAAAATAAACASVVLGTPAAASTGEIRSVTSTAESLSITFAGVDLPAGASLNTATVRVRVDGADVDSTAVLSESAAATAADQRSVMLLIDTSGSMKGEGIKGAKSAALAFVAALPPDVNVGLAVFSDTARVVNKPDKSRAGVRKSISELVADGETALYDGIRTAVTAVGRSGQRRIVLLSDGGDTASRAKLPRVLDDVRKSGVGVDAVAFKTVESLEDVLVKVARAGRGKVHRTGDEAALTRAFGAAAQAFASQLLIKAAVPPELAGREVVVRIDARAGGKTLSDQRTIRLAKIVAPPPPVGVEPGAFVRPAVPPAIRADTLRQLAPWLGVLLVGLLLLSAFALSNVASARSGETRVRKVLASYTLTGRHNVVVEQDATALGDTRIARSAVELADRVVQRRGLEARLTLKLSRAAFALRPSEWVVLQSLAGLVATIVFSFFGVKLLLALLLGFAIGIAGTSAFLAFKAGRRQRAFEASLPDSLQLIAGSLSAGYSLPQALDAVVREGSEPITSEIGRAITQSRLGRALEDGLDDVAMRMASRDFSWVVMAIRIQHEVGGNLAEVLMTVSHTIRERARLHRQVRALSAEGRLSAYILIGLPFVVAGLVALTNGDYLRPLYTETPGRVLLLGAVLLMLLGSLWMRKMIKVEV